MGMPGENRRRLLPGESLAAPAQRPELEFRLRQPKAGIVLFQGGVPVPHRRQDLLQEVGGAHPQQGAVGIRRKAQVLPAEQLPVEEQLQFPLHIVHQLHYPHRSGMGVQQFLQCGGVHHRKPGDLPRLGKGLGVKPPIPRQHKEQRPGLVPVLEYQVFHTWHPDGGVQLLGFGGGLRLPVKLHPLIRHPEPVQQVIALPFPGLQLPVRPPGRPGGYGKITHVKLSFLSSIGAQAGSSGSNTS